MYRVFLLSGTRIHPPGRKFQKVLWAILCYCSAFYYRPACACYIAYSSVGCIGHRQKIIFIVASFIRLAVVGIGKHKLQCSILYLFPVHLHLSLRGIAGVAPALFLSTHEKRGLYSDLFLFLFCYRAMPPLPSKLQPKARQSLKPAENLARPLKMLLSLGAISLRTVRPSLSSQMAP